MKQGRMDAGEASRREGEKPCGRTVPEVGNSGSYGRLDPSCAGGDQNLKRGASGVAAGCGCRMGIDFEEDANPRRGEFDGSHRRTTETEEDPKDPDRKRRRSNGGGTNQ